MVGNPRKHRVTTCVPLSITMSFQDRKSTTGLKSKSTRGGGNPYRHAPASRQSGREGPPPFS